MDQLSLFKNTAIQSVADPKISSAEKISSTPQKISKKSMTKSAKKSSAPAQKSENPMKKVHRKIVTDLRTYFQKHNFNIGILGLSGGIDSSLTLKLAVDALGAENVIGVIMPEVGLTAQENIDHAKRLAEFLEVKTLYQPINTFIIDFKIVSWKPNELAEMNTRARIRSVLLYNIANTFNGFVLGTSNKSEIMLGYGTKYGDLAADIEVIGDLYKTEVYELARYLHFSEVLINKTPSAELKSGQTDEEELGASYKDLDHILMQFEKGRTVEGLIDRGLDPTLVHRIARRIATSKHKREMPPIVLIR